MLHLTATDEEDLAVISAQMQDAVIRAGDMKLLKKPRKFAFVANRFAWDALPEQQRRRCGVTITSVQSAIRNGPKQLNPDTVLSLLAMTFVADTNEPSGTLRLDFSGGHSFTLEVECLDVTLDDLGPAWGTDHVPDHKLDGAT